MTLPVEAMWHPIAASSDLALRHVFHGQLLGQEIVLAGEVGTSGAMKRGHNLLEGMAMARTGDQGGFAAAQESLGLLRQLRKEGVKTVAGQSR